MFLFLGNKARHAELIVSYVIGTGFVFLFLNPLEGVLPLDSMLPRTL